MEKKMTQVQYLLVQMDSKTSKEIYSLTESRNKVNLIELLLARSPQLN